ncbi:hypothetical protein HS088_TW11G00294 [Tripterygium wilfordii]|uniref:Uncharacterized protein n=1 Tax=Tripterygium wilfordii TaxID=458696 RepID=A0A7J7D1T0_TRIWF|nr:uncharacterized protein LOC120009140 [Tripterygium wilfordii]KAF5740228.1 hypothetical protein HS088_TW11G00294 [Tripterygium wilfordii]
MDNKDEALKSQIAIRCANAAARLLSLRSSPNHLLDDQDEEKERMSREITDMKIELVRERVRSRRIKLCSFMEFALQVVTVLSASTLLLMLAFNSA